MIDFDYTAPELMPFRVQEVRDNPEEPHKIGGIVYAPATWQRSRWHELFGTPERAAWTLIDCNAFKQCVDCPVCHDEHGETCEIPGDCAFVMRDYYKLLEWLKGEGDA